MHVMKYPIISQIAVGDIDEENMVKYFSYLFLRLARLFTFKNIFIFILVIVLVFLILLIRMPILDGIGYLYEKGKIFAISQKGSGFFEASSILLAALVVFPINRRLRALSKKRERIEHRYRDSTLEKICESLNEVASVYEYNTGLAAEVIHLFNDSIDVDQGNWDKIRIKIDEIRKKAQEIDPPSISNILMAGRVLEIPEHISVLIKLPRAIKKKNNQVIYQILGKEIDDAIYLLKQKKINPKDVQGIFYSVVNSHKPVLEELYEALDVLNAIILTLDLDRINIIRFLKNPYQSFSMYLHIMHLTNAKDKLDTAIMRSDEEFKKMKNDLQKKIGSE
jgi:hypothetical protein